MNKEVPVQATVPDLDIEGIKRVLPHRPPFLMVDKLTELRPGESAVGWKAVTINEPFFAGHFPDYAVMPGVLIVEAMAQTAGALVSYTLGLADSRLAVFFMGIDKARFRRPVRPGALLRMPVRAQQRRGPVWRFEGKVFNGEDLCAEAEYTAMIAAKQDSSAGPTPGTPAGTE
jgi:3-hydroxyacyl-[acyl-carrier-protein] dehydratase